MFDRELLFFREQVRNHAYLMTLHAEEEKDDDGLTIFDVESIILTGIIVERQRDKHSSEWKYLIEGRTLSNKYGIVVSKSGFSGRMIIITVYLL